MQVDGNPLSNTSVPSPRDVKPQIAGEAQKLSKLNRAPSIGPPPDVKPNISQISMYLIIAIFFLEFN